MDQEIACRLVVGIVDLLRGPAGYALMTVEVELSLEYLAMVCKINVLELPTGARREQGAAEGKTVAIRARQGWSELRPAKAWSAC